MPADPTPAAPDQAEGPQPTPEDAMREDVATYLSEVERLRRDELARLRAREIL